MNATYNIVSAVPVVGESLLSRVVGLPLSVVRDLPYGMGEPRERLVFHLTAGDYFSVVNTVLGFCEEEAVKNFNDIGIASESPLLRGIRILRRDLDYLDRHYQIVPKVRK